MLPKRKTWRNVTSGARGARLHWGQPAGGRRGCLCCCQQCRGENNNEIMMLMNFLSSKKYSQSFSWSFLDNWGVCLWRVWLANLGTDWETGFKIWSDFVKDFLVVWFSIYLSQSMITGWGESPWEPASDKTLLTTFEKVSCSFSGRARQKGSDCPHALKNHCSFISFQRRFDQVCRRWENHQCNKVGRKTQSILIEVVISVAGLYGYPGLSVYCATKQAIEGFSDVWNNF